MCEIKIRSTMTLSSVQYNISNYKANQQRILLSFFAVQQQLYCEVNVENIRYLLSLLPLNNNSVLRGNNNYITRLTLNNFNMFSTVQ